MGVFKRQTKRGVVYWIAFQYEGRQIQQRHGLNKREAKREHERIVKAIEDGEWSPRLGDQTGELRLKTFANQWMAKRNNRSFANDEQRMRDYIIPILGEVKMADLRQKHVKLLVDEVRSKRSAKTTRNVYALLRTMCRDAHIEELITVDPCVLPRSSFVGPAKRRSVYTREEVRALLDPEKVGFEAMVFNALLFFTGMREGEACGRRFRDWDPVATPLGCLTVSTQYDDQPLKTDHPRAVPVHPVLAEVLGWWQREGYELVYGRPPSPSDYLLLSKRRIPLNRWTGAYLFKTARKAAGVENRSLHATRHTFITWAQRCGAVKARVEIITHNAKGDIVDQYTHLGWEPLCETISLLRYDSPHSAPSDGRIVGNPGVPASGADRENAPGFAMRNILGRGWGPAQSAKLMLDSHASHTDSHVSGDGPGVRKTPVPPLLTGDPDADDWQAAVAESVARAEAFREGRS